MNMLDKVMEELQEQGFRPQKEDNFILFKYQMLNYLFLVDEDDEDFFSLYIPYMFQADDENIMDVYKAMNNVNNSIKVVKLLINEDDVWAACECRWPKDADISEILSFAIVTLFRAYGDFHKELKNL